MWRSITIDQCVLQIVSHGYTLSFVAPPPVPILDSLSFLLLFQNVKTCGQKSGPSSTRALLPGVVGVVGVCSKKTIALIAPMIMIPYINFR